MGNRAVIAVGHRGAAAYAPENTVASFDEAVRLGARAVEFDLRLTADGVPVVLHDDTLERTTNGRGPVSGWEWNDLLRVDAGSWMHYRFAGTRIPSLDEALLAIGPWARPVIELKVPIPAKLLLAAIRKYDLENEALIISFEPTWLEAVRRESRDLALGVLAEQWSNDLPSIAEQVGAEVLGLHTEIIGTSQVAAAEAKRLEVWAFTANDVGMVAACAAMGVTGIITDRPDLIRAR